MRKSLLLVFLIVSFVTVFSQEWVTESFGPITWSRPADWQVVPPLGVNSTGVYKDEAGIGFLIIYDTRVTDTLLNEILAGAELQEETEKNLGALKGKYYKLVSDVARHEVTSFKVGMKDLVVWCFAQGEPSEEDLNTLKRIEESIALKPNVFFSVWKGEKGELELYQRENYVEALLGDTMFAGVIFGDQVIGWWRTNEGGNVGPDRIWNGSFKMVFDGDELELSVSEGEDPFAQAEGIRTAFRKSEGTWSAVRTPSIEFREVLLCRGMYEGKPIGLGKAFYPFDKRVVAWLSTAPFREAHIAKWEWYDPSGKKRETSYQMILPAMEVGKETQEGLMGTLVGFPEDGDFGDWTVKVYVDNELFATASFSFTEEIGKKLVETPEFTLEVPDFVLYESYEESHYFIFDITDYIFIEAHIEAEDLNLEGEGYKTKNYEVLKREDSFLDPDTWKFYRYWIVQFPKKDNGYLYMSFYAPEDDFEKMREVFEEVLNSVVLK